MPTELEYESESDRIDDYWAKEKKESSNRLLCKFCPYCGYHIKSKKKMALHLMDCYFKLTKKESPHA